MRLTQARFDDGHRFEALARPRAEELIGEDFYPVTGSLGKLSASFDGITLGERRGVGAQDPERRDPRCEVAEQLGLHYRVQMEQQLLVSGAERCLFLATKWDDNDTLAEERHFWYAPDAALRAEIIAGWAQFEADLADLPARRSAAGASGRRGAGPAGAVDSRRWPARPESQPVAVRREACSRSSRTSTRTRATTRRSPTPSGRSR
jgi:predicted phage-related endonuclease